MSRSSRILASALVTLLGIPPIPKAQTAGQRVTFPVIPVNRVIVSGNRLAGVRLDAGFVAANGTLGHKAGDPKAIADTAVDVNQAPASASPAKHPDVDADSTQRFPSQSRVVTYTIVAAP